MSTICPLDPTTGVSPDGRRRRPPPWSRRRIDRRGSSWSRSFDGTIQLWKTSKQTQLGPALTGDEDATTDLEFSPDETKLLSASASTLRLWPVPPSPDAARDQLCSKLTYNMNREQWNKSVSPEIPYEEACKGLPEAS
jgi:WD40 repeat protein